MSAHLHDLNRRALEPGRSVVIEACAGSGKTWLLVSRMVRLLLAGARPSQILAITFTRKAAQEMAARLHTWLRELAALDDDKAREFLRQREIPASGIEAALLRARGLYEEFLTAQPPLTITTFHSWFLQLLKRAPLDAAAVGDAVLSEQTAALKEEAWQQFAAHLQRDRSSPAAPALEALFARYGLRNTRQLLLAFLERRADWWAYTREERGPVAFALQRIRAQMLVSPDVDVLAALFADRGFVRDIQECADLLAKNTATDKAHAVNLRNALASSEHAVHFQAVCAAFLKKGDGQPSPRKANATQAVRLGAKGEADFLAVHARLAARLMDERQKLADQQAYRLNEAGLTAGVALLEAYQRVKRERHAIDFADIEWLTYELLSNGDHAAYIQYKLDASYRYVLLDEFQDTNPLQWLTLDAWFAAAEESDARPTVFVVGDPKQAIYRFRRAESGLFARLRTYLKERYQADVDLEQDESRRCAPPVVDLVNRLFADEQGFKRHEAHFKDKPGRIDIFPLVTRAAAVAPVAPADARLRDPLSTPLIEEEDHRHETEAQQLIAGVREIVGRWTIIDEDGATRRPARYRDIMVLVRRRTHLEAYERALRHADIPFVTSRQGGLLDTLEAQDLIALLQFLVAPFEDLKLAQVLRSPFFSCSDDDLVLLARAAGDTWWQRLCGLSSTATPVLKRAHGLLERWLERADTLPVHDQLDRIYFEADLMRRYESAVPPAMRGGVIANLQAFIQRALNTDSGRYPSLPRFLHELIDLREAPQQEAPDEGIIGDTADALRILTVHGAKGLESPVVWLLDAAAGADNDRAYDVMVDWSPEARAPRHVSLRSVKDELSADQIRLTGEQATLAARENLNLLYVAITRAKQALLVSGSEERGSKESWYARMRCALRGSEEDMSTRITEGDDLAALPASVAHEAGCTAASAADLLLKTPIPTGTRAQLVSGRGKRYGSNFHLLMERLTSGAASDGVQLQRDLGISERELSPLLKQAHALLDDATLARFFDPSRFVSATNEVPLVLADGELRRIDRLVEFENEIWVLDYKTGHLKESDQVTAQQYRAQVAEYREAIRSIYPEREVKAAIVFADAGVIYVD